MATLRGFARYPAIATMKEAYGLRAAALAVYPMYRGLARLVGMDILEVGGSLETQAAALEQAWKSYDFFFLHYKYTDSTGEDGNFSAKVQRIEQFDTIIPRVRALTPG
jgi:2,3-bisphosphoglycerate-independent phosphoglycerate mutase